MDCENIELYKCSFIELLDYNDTKKSCVERRKFRSKNFNSVTEGEKQNTYTHSNDIKNSHNQLNTQSMVSKKNELQNFFMFDKLTKKSYLIRSEESLIIMSIVSFYNKALGLHEKNDKEVKDKIAEYAKIYSEYSGIIEIAVCNKKQINQSYSDLSQFSFKKQYLIIKQGKCRIYNMKQKDKINLMEYELKIDSRLPFVPSNPFSFVLEKVVKTENPAEEDAKKKEEQMSSQQSSVVMFNPSSQNENSGKRSPQTNLFDKISKNEVQNNPGNILNQKTIPQNQTAQQQPTKQGFFQKIFQKIYKKTPDRLVIAADSDYKRKQWIFTINFHKTMLVRMKKKNKASFGYHQSFNTNHFFSNLNTLENEFGQSIFPQNSLTSNAIGQAQTQNPSFHQQQLAQVKKARQNGRASGFGSGEHKQNGSIQGKNPLKLSEIEGDNDYYDIFAQKDVVEEVKEEDEEHNEDSPKMKPYKYNPNDYKDKLATTQANQSQAQGQTRNPHHSRQGSAQQALNTHNGQMSNLGTNVYKQSITRTTEEGLYTMSFPQNNPLFKKSLVVYDNTNIIMNSKEIRTITDGEIWQKFLKHFLVFNHQHSEIDLSTFGSGGDNHLHNGGNNLSYQKSTNYTCALSKSTPMSKFINHNAFVFNQQENYEQNIPSLQLTHQQEQSNHELQSSKSFNNMKQQSNQYQESTLFQEKDCYVEEYIEPAAQNINSRSTQVHKQY